VRIVDLSGQTVSSLQNAGQEVRWAPQNLKSGLYFAQVQGNNQMQTVPLMIP
jgi:hypothetical protein